MFRSRDTNNRDRRLSSEPEASSGGGGASLNLWVEPVLDDQDSTKSPPGSPSVGDRYIVPGGATGAWSGHGGEIAEWTNSAAWSFDYTFDEGSESFVTHREKVIHMVEFNEPGDFANQKVFATNSFVQTWLSDVLVDYLTNTFAGSIIDTRNTPPASPLHGDRYIVGSSPTGVWSSVGSAVDTIAMAVRDMNSNTYKWVHRTPDTGTIVYDTSSTSLKRWSGSAWVPFPSLVSLSDVNITTGAGVDAYVVTYDHGTGKFILAIGPAPGAHTLVSHSDVNITPGPGVDGYVVTYDDGTGKFILAAAGAPSPHALDGHTDTNLGSPGPGEDGYYVGWDDGAGEYTLQAIAIPTHNHTLDSLSNVSTGGKTTNSSIRWSGSAWVAYLPTLAGLDDVTISSPTTGQVLSYNGSRWVNASLSASVPSGTGRAAALWTGAVGSGSWTYTVVGSTAFDGSWPYFLIPSGYTKARVTTTYSNNVSTLIGSSRGNSLATGSQIGIGCILATGGLTSGLSTNVSAYFFGTGQVSGTKEQRLEYTSPIFSVSSGNRIYPFNDSSGTVPYVDTNPLFMQIELFT